MARDEFSTEGELYQGIGVLEDERSRMQDYIGLLEKTLKDYRSRKRNRVVDRLTKENLQYKVQLQERDKKVAELAEELAESLEDISDLEKELANASAVIDSFTANFGLPYQHKTH